MYRALFICLAIPLLWWAFRDIPVHQIYETLLGISPPALFGLALLNGFIFILLSSRWWLVMRALGNKLPLFQLIAYRLAAFGISYLTPGPQFGGEPLQVHLVHKRHNLSGTVALAGVTLDKLVELLANFSFLVIGLLLLFNSSLPHSSGLSMSLPIAVGMLVLPIAYLALLRMGYYPFSSLLGHQPTSTGWKTALRHVKESIASAEIQVSSFIRRKPGALFSALTLSVISWVFMILEYWLALRILGIHIEPVQVIFALTAVRVAFLSPFPAGLGALEAGQVAAMQLIGVEPALGISVSLLIRARDLSLAMLGVWIGGLLTSTSPIKLPVITKATNVLIQKNDQP